MPENSKSTSQYSETPTRDFYLDLWVAKEIGESVEDKVVIIESKYHLRPDLMAFDLYGSANLWWVFAMANKDYLIDPINDFVAGIEITQPAANTIKGMT